MKQTRSIHSTLKKLMRSRGHTYAQAAGILGLSEASIKRLFSKQKLSLERLESLCDWLQVDIQELVRLSREYEPLTTQLTDAQETELMQDTGQLLLAHLLLNQWSPEEILDVFVFTRPELTRRMFRLQKLGLLEVLPFDRIRLRTARNFSWRRDGPVQRFFSENVLTEFMQSAFDGAGETLDFVSGMLTRESVLHMQSRIRDLAREFDDLVEADLRFPADQRFGTSLCLAARPWEFSGFTQYRSALPTKKF